METEKLVELEEGALKLLVAPAVAVSEHVPGIPVKRTVVPLTMEHAPDAERDTAAPDVTETGIVSCGPK